MLDNTMPANRATEQTLSVRVPERQTRYPIELEPTESAT